MDIQTFKTRLLARIYFNPSNKDAGTKPPIEKSILTYIIQITKLLIILFIERGKGVDDLKPVVIALGVLSTELRLKLSNHTASAMSLAVDKLDGLVLSRAEMLFVKGLIEKEQERIWRENWSPMLMDKTYKQVMAEYLSHINDMVPPTPEAHCVGLLERIKKREYEIDEYVQKNLIGKDVPKDTATGVNNSDKPNGVGGSNMHKPMG